MQSTSTTSPNFYGFSPEDTYYELRREIDVIDGFEIVSFKHLSDLEEYSKTHGRISTHPMKGEPSPPVSNLKGQGIKPTKTGDITKIKGWRNKVFASELCQESQSYNTVNPPPVPEPKKILGKCEETVRETVSDLVDYVVRKESFDVLDIPLDPDVPHLMESDDIIENHPKKFRKSRVARELSKLCNVSLVEEEMNSNKSLCCKEYCLKGCVCDSLSGELLDNIEPHCRNEECMFECTCGKSSRRKGMLSARKSNLAKEESTWHQKVICNSSEVLFQGDIVKTKREKKMPTRYRQGDLYLGKEMHLLDPSPKHLKSVKSTGKLFDENLNIMVSSSKRRYPPKLRNPKEICAKSSLKGVVGNITSEDTPEKEVPDNGEDSADEDSSEKLDVIPDHQESDDAPIFEMDEIEETLGEIEALKSMDHILNYPFIWCTLHSDYFCSCSGHVFCTKLNILIKDKIYSKHCTLEELSAKMSNAARFSIIHPFNREHECARTAGSCFNYRTRNKSLLFKEKRELEIKNNIFSSTNSLVKLHVEGLDNCISYFDQYTSKMKAVEKVIASSCLLDRIHSKVHQKLSNSLSSDGESPSGSDTVRISFPASLPESSRLREAVVDLDSGRESASLCLPSTSLHSPPSPQVNEPAEIFKFGLLCMTRGFGYLPVNCYTPVKLSVRDPLNISVFHTFRDLHAANLWLNRFFKERIMFEDSELKLEWVIVRANLLKELPIFDRRVLFKAVDRYGRLVNKKKLMWSRRYVVAMLTKNARKISTRMWSCCQKFRIFHLKSYIER